MNKRPLSLALILLVVLALGVTGLITFRPDVLSNLIQGQPAPPMGTATQPPTPSSNRPAVPSALDTSDFSAIAALSAPSVVNISTRVEGDQQADEKDDPDRQGGDPFLPFFGPQEAPQSPLPREGMGSGFIVRKDGVILTNAHVVHGATDVSVKLHDRREFKAKVVGVDKLSDTAVLKIEGGDFPVVPIGNPNETRVGEWVLAIGSPFGFENTVTAGIVSAKARALPEEGYVPFIQTDVAVNPGNSGGPLINTRGEVIGINSQIYSSSGGYQGLSFAIPIDVALDVESQILEKGKVVRGRIGVSVQDLSQGLAESFGLENPDGALVGMVNPEGPAAKAGVKPGDVILALNGEKVIDSRSLPPRVAVLKPGSHAGLLIHREGKRQTIDVTVEALDDTPDASPEKPAKGEKPGRLGLSIRPLSPEERQKRGTEAVLLIERVQGPALKAGIQPGDLLLAINGQKVTDVESVRQISDRVPSHLALLIEREGHALFIPLILEPKTK